MIHYKTQCATSIQAAPSLISTHRSLVRCHLFESAAAFVPTSPVVVSSSPSLGWRCFEWSLSRVRRRTTVWQCSPCCRLRAAALPSHASSALSSHDETIDARDQAPALPCWSSLRDHSTTCAQAEDVTKFRQQRKSEQQIEWPLIRPQNKYPKLFCDLFVRLNN